MNIQESHSLHNDKYTPGAYFALLISHDSKNQLLQFCENELALDMSNAQSPYEPRSHSTLFSAKEMNGKQSEELKELIVQSKTFIAKGLKWDIFKSDNTGNPCLALKIESEDMVAFHRFIAEKTGLKHSFPEYTPHLSIHYNFRQPIPHKIPDFDIILQEMYYKPYFFKNKHEKDEPSIIVPNKLHVLNNINQFRSDCYIDEHVSNKKMKK